MFIHAPPDVYARAPVSPYTVMRELGHSSIALIEETYGHLSNVGVRSPVVEYREATVVPFAQRKASVM